MTIEEKAKAYDEALDRMKYVVVVPKDKKALQALKETIFPELKESEDERISKVLLNLVSNDKVAGYTKFYDERGITCDDAIAYLEKLKEQKDWAEELNTKIKELHKQCIAAIAEQKEPIDPFDTKLFQDGVKEGRRLEREDIKKEQKPADDEAKAIAYREYERGRESGLRDGQKYVLDNAESYGLCKPAEWSEDDEDKLYQIIEILLADKEIARRDNPQHHDVLCKAYDKLISWLKSLRPHWKPSEEQMQYLLAVINDPNNAGAESCHLILESLYNDLKEL